MFVFFQCLSPKGVFLARRRAACAAAGLLRGQGAALACPVRTQADAQHPVTLRFPGGICGQTRAGNAVVSQYTSRYPQSCGISRWQSLLCSAGCRLCRAISSEVSMEDFNDKRQSNRTRAPRNTAPRRTQRRAAAPKPAQASPAVETVEQPSRPPRTRRAPQPPPQPGPGRRARRAAGAAHPAAPAAPPAHVPHPRGGAARRSHAHHPAGRFGRSGKKTSPCMNARAT